MNSKGILVLSIAGMLGLSGVARADRALVIGINTYPNLESDDQLRGCVNDAASVAAMLKARHFADVRPLTDAKATKQGILDAIDALGQGVGPNERVVIFYAGHGTRESDGSGALVPSDAELNSQSHDLTADEFYTHVKEIQSSKKTVLLDSCFSGSMLRSKGIGGHALKSRAFVRGRRDQSKRIVIATDGPDGLSSGVCYFTAARKSEPANEMRFDDGERHGLFTYSLVKRLASDSAEVWGSVQTDVSKQISDDTDDSQHPTLSPDFTDKNVFDGAGNPPPPPVPPAPKPHTVWDDYNMDHSDASKLAFQISPERANFQLTDRFKMSVRTGDEGYLVVLERDTDDDVDLLYPENGDVDSAHVSSNTVGLLGGADLKFDQAGTERVKAILFTSRDQAKAMLDAFMASAKKDGGGAHMARKTLRRIQRAEPDPVVPAAFYTSDVLFQVTSPGTVGRIQSHSSAGSAAMRFCSLLRGQSAEKLYVEPLRDGGGLGKGPDGRPMNSRLTSALRTFLHEDAPKLQLTDSKGDAGWLLEGEVSRQGSGVSDAGLYMAVLRLHDLGSDGRIAAQVAGTAETVRDLTDNMQFDPSIDSRGLIGEMALRVSRAIDAQSTGTRAQLSEWLGSAQMLNYNLSAKVVGAGGLRLTTDAPRYKISVTSSVDGEVFLVGQIGDNLFPMFVPPLYSERAVQAGVARSFPEADSFTTASSKPTAIFVLVRRTVQERTSRSVGSGRRHPGIAVVGSELDSPTLDPALDRLLHLAKTDPKGMWSVVKIDAGPLGI